MGTKIRKNPNRPKKTGVSIKYLTNNLTYIIVRRLAYSGLVHYYTLQDWVQLVDKSIVVVVLATYKESPKQ
jgi:hypothetical protein